MTAVAAPAARTARRARTATQPAMPTGRKVGWAAANAITIAWTLFPIWWLIALAFKAPTSLTDGSFWPNQWSWSNFSGIFHGTAFVQPLINSIGIGLISTVISVVLGTMAAYAIARLKFPGKSALIGVSLLIAMFPLISLVTPLFNVERVLGLFNTWPGLIIPYLAFSLPLAIYTLSAFFREIPWDLEKAAKVDGASQRQIFLKVIAPLALPGIATTSILVFMFCWNEFLLAISLTSTNAARTAPAAMGFFTGVSQFTFPIGSIAAAAVIITIPIVIFVMIFQRRIVAGLTAGAVKG
jgi:multiple sugar transport system permease protein